MDYPSFHNELSSLIPHFLAFDQTSLLSNPSDRNHPRYSGVQVKQAPCEPKNTYPGFPEHKAWSLLQAHKIVYIDPQSYAAFKSQTNFLLECHSDS